MEAVMWVFASIAIPTLLGLGWGAMQMINAHYTEFRIARACFWAAGIIPALATIYSLSQMKAPVWERMIIGALAAVIIGLAEIYLLKWVREREKRSRLIQPAEPSTPFPPTGGIWQPFADFSDPAYDQFFERSSPSSWQESLIKKGQPLVEQWTTRLDYPEKQRRENESVNWLSDANTFARKHLKGEQLDQFINNYRTAMAPARKYEFVIALENAGTQPGTQELDIAFEIAGKVKLLERFRDGLTQPSSTHDNGRRQRSPEMTAVIDKAVGLLTQDLGLRKFPLRALQMAGVGNLQTEDEFDQVRESIIQHSFGDPLVGVSSHPSGTQWLAAIKWANRNNVNLVNWNVLIDCVRNSKLP